MLDKYEKSILNSLNQNQPNQATDKYPIYYQENNNLIRQEADGTKYKIELTKDNQEKIIAKIQ